MGRYASTPIGAPVLSGLPGGGCCNYGLTPRQRRLCRLHAGGGGGHTRSRGQGVHGGGFKVAFVTPVGPQSYRVLRRVRHSAQVRQGGRRQQGSPVHRKLGAVPAAASTCTPSRTSSPRCPTRRAPQTAVCSPWVSTRWGATGTGPSTAAASTGWQSPHRAAPIVGHGQAPWAPALGLSMTPRGSGPPACPGLSSNSAAASSTTGSGPGYPTAGRCPSSDAAALSPPRLHLTLHTACTTAEASAWWNQVTGSPRATQLTRRLVAARAAPNRAHGTNCADRYDTRCYCTPPTSALTLEVR